jgi:hypothetical protein
MSQEAELPSPATLLQLRMGMRASQALYVAAKLGVADHLAERPMTSAELASRVAADREALRRLLRALVALRVFAEREPDLFELTPVGQFLCDEAAVSLRSLVLFLTGEVRWRCWADLLQSVRTGEPAADRILGMPLFDYYAANPEQSILHDAALAGTSALASPAILGSYDFSGFRCVVDVGGGSGRLLADILREHQHLQGILFDLPHVVHGAHEVLAGAGVADRRRIEEGSFFETVPVDGDLYILKEIVHDWDDARATAILTTCRKTMPERATLLVVDRVLPEIADRGKAVDAYFLDLEMLVMAPRGRERTEGEFAELLRASGFVLERVISMRSPLSIVEARAK